MLAVSKYIEGRLGHYTMILYINNQFFEVNNLEPLPIYKKILTEDKILVMYNAYKNNLAPIKI